MHCPAVVGRVMLCIHLQGTPLCQDATLQGRFLSDTPLYAGSAVVCCVCGLVPWPGPLTVQTSSGVNRKQMKSQLQIASWALKPIMPTLSLHGGPRPVLSRVSPDGARCLGLGQGEPAFPILASLRIGP